MVNTGNLAVATVQTPDGVVRYDGDTAISGVPGTAAPIPIDFMDTAGSVCESMLPTGNARDTINGIEVTCIDNGMPVVVIPASALGKTGYEAPKELENDAGFRNKLEALRLAAGPLMGLGDVKDKVVPKMSLIAPPRAGGHVCTRTFIPHKCHAAIGVLGAVSVATACVLPGSVARGIAKIPSGKPIVMSVEHPSGEFTVQLEVEGDGANFSVGRSGILRTARALFEGHLLIPQAIWEGK
jgi:4-oxalomesaconate tautomerase